ncbi:amidase signature enzyme [Bimuria novae-zelandiae CBS 107.79]|uniref:Amidase signature enzyme n=1 Tax=Bimuria novae-zelandiae CBS 107.79 TaxID=1447943 RepID=A0A6A5V3W9_9PLEO|nr:amidase signature enzyme [Bimuria novae-zelandiae CBS 107.79]
MAGLLFSASLTALLASISVSAVPIVKRNEYTFILNNPYGDAIFELGNVSYLANTVHPKAVLATDCKAATSLLPITVVKTNESTISQATLEGIISSYLEADDVFSHDFLDGLYISSTVRSSLDASAVEYLGSFSTSFIFVDDSISGDGPFSKISIKSSADMPAGPYLASIEEGSVSLATVYRLCPDTYRTFLFGAYNTNDGEQNHSPLGVFLPKFWDPMIPPLAGERVAIKDLYDVKGLQTSGGSQAWVYITPIANGTAPSVQQIFDLGGVVVGKQKLAQFASGANPWEWQDEHYPFNPRGDGWLTCSASSFGGGCSIAAYDWLDYAIGSDTGSSMRRPAAVSGTYCQRPSQGMISLERVLPLGGASDTAGVFSRDPYKWIKFAKNWYSPSLHQDASITAAEPILQDFIANMSRILNMTVKEFNFTATVQNWTDPLASNLTTLTASTSVINTWSTWEVIGRSLTTAWVALFDGRFPPIDPARRPGWRAFNESRTNQTAYNAALVTKNIGVEWYERELNESPDASYLAALPKGTKITGANICPIFGCADFTVPIGQVPYQSNITFHEEMVPVTINMVVKRGCDFMIYNMIEKLVDEGVLKTVKTGRTAY